MDGSQLVFNNFWPLLIYLVRNKLSYPFSFMSNTSVQLLNNACIYRETLNATPLLFGHSEQRYWLNHIKDVHAAMK